MRCKKVYAPIGVDCRVADFLRRQGLRHIALPFDWNVTPTKSAVELISSDFANFFERENMTFFEPCERQLFEERGAKLMKSKEMITPVLCVRYGMLFPHDFSIKGDLDFLDVRKKYMRRVDRFRKLVASTKNVVLVYTLDEINEWQCSFYNKSGISWNTFQADALSSLGSLSPRFDVISLQDLKAQFPEMPRRPNLPGRIFRKMKQIFS